MNRVSLDDGSWFDADEAQSWQERTWWDGNNHISCATGSQWDHEELFRTKNGQFVLHFWSQWEKKQARWEMLDDQAGFAWLARNDHYDELPDELVKDLEI